MWDPRNETGPDRTGSLPTTKIRLVDPGPSSLECHKARVESTDSMENTAPEIAPIPAPRNNPLSAARPIRPPATAPTTDPTEANL